jgi:hypothetical protein
MIAGSSSEHVAAERPAAPAAGQSLSVTVAADLERVFAEAPALRRSDADRARDEPGRRRRRRSAEAPGLRHAGAGVLAGAVLVGLLVGLVLQRPAPKAVEAAQPVQATPVYASAYPEGMPIATPLPLAATPVEPVQPAVVAAPPRPLPKARPPRRAAAGQACGRSCSYDEVMAADRRLRQSYREAVRAGVPHGVLVSYRDDWSRARRRSDDPRALVARYGDLRADLEREIRRRGDERVATAGR